MGVERRLSTAERMLWVVPFLARNNEPVAILF
jgi:hypothetical protein